ncbi:4-alpha-glucanotransferase DPE2-like isoform X2 [Solanum pennellii]|uniref:4-alpha-glucanotransferase DPE2-like isoform X2 n=1 Tax=Solanum pennellii TaxID=28526 RepID=A0ABM1G576_SOLPN|nr:4-alpha-glucanotransferase DPE2-like isoform X2 [Solanum pennellii]
MVNSGLKSRKVSFRIPYYTQWGQNVLICGSDRLLGSWNVKKGLLLKPSHQGEELIWSGSIPVPPGYQSEYSYYVVDDRRNILRWEVGKKRKLLLPDGFQDGQSLELHDLWQDFNVGHKTCIRGVFGSFGGAATGYAVEELGELR